MLSLVSLRVDIVRRPVTNYRVAFQDMTDSMQATLPFMSHDGHVNESDDNLRWDSFARDT